MKNILAIGNIHCEVISDGFIAVPLTVPGQTEADTEREYENMDISCLLIKAADRTILVDTGCGSSFQDTAGKLVTNLIESGTKPGDINTIIYTHGHEDHVGGSFTDDGTAVFQNARYIVSRKEWESWEMKPETPLNEGLFASARKNLLKIKDRFDLVEDDHEVIPGLTLLPARGHSLGGVIVRIGDQTGENTLLCIGDLIHSLTEFEDPARYSFLDADPVSAVQLRTKGLSEIAESGDLVHACHFAFPGLGHIVKTDGRLGWEPLH